MIDIKHDSSICLCGVNFNNLFPLDGSNKLVHFINVNKIEVNIIKELTFVQSDGSRAATN